MIRTQKMTGCTTILGLSGVVLLLVSLIADGTAIGIPYWTTHTLGHVGLFEVCRNGIGDCLDIDVVFDGYALELAQLASIFGISSATCLILASTSLLVYQCFDTIDHSKILIGASGVTFAFIGGASISAAVALRLHVEYNILQTVGDSQFTNTFLWGMYLAAWAALGSFLSGFTFILHLFMAVYF